MYHDFPVPRFDSSFNRFVLFVPGEDHVAVQILDIARFLNEMEVPSRYN
jgi:hypothetical protein